MTKRELVEVLEATDVPDDTEVGYFGEFDDWCPVQPEVRTYVFRQGLPSLTNVELDGDVKGLVIEL